MDEAALRVLKIVAAPVKSLIVDRIKKHVDYIRNYNANMHIVQEKLQELCNKKLQVDDAVRQGKEKGEKIKRGAVSWLKSVEILTQMKELNTLMEDDKVAYIAVNLMERRVLKTLLRKDKGVLDRVVKMVKENSIGSEGGVYDGVALNKDDYERVGEVVVQVIAETMEEFKKLMKEDIKMAVVVMELMVDQDLENLIKGDKEMAEIVREVEAISEKDMGLCDRDEEQELLAQKHDVSEVKPEEKHTIKEAVKLLGGLVMDPSFLKELPESAQYGLKVMYALCKSEGLISHGDYPRSHIYCDGCTDWLQDLRRHHDLSEAAEKMISQIDDVIKKYPGEQVMRPKRADEGEDIQSGFLKGLQSREEILQDVMKALKNDNVNAVGVYGMGGSGKTILAKEVSSISKAKGMFHEIIMVEISEVADIERIQDQIADALHFPLGGIHGLSFRAKELYNRLKDQDDKKRKMLVILDNMWEKLSLNDLGIPHEYCKLLITSRKKDVCEEMDVQSRNILQVDMLNNKEARALFQYQVGRRVDKGEYKSLADRLLDTCRGLPLSITTTAYALKGKDLAIWQKFAEELEKPISAQISGVHHKTYSVIKSSYDFMENEEKKQFFLLACLSPIGSSISVETLMRHATGLGLLQKVNKLSEANKQAHRWVEELVSSSMLLKGDSKEEVKIHDVVRASAISFAAKDSGHKFLVEAIPRWMKNEALKDYTAISLLSQGFDHFPIRTGVHGDKLRILLLKGSTCTIFLSGCFEGMTNLEVLTLKSIVVSTELSDSIGTLRKLKTLHLEDCKLEDIKAIGLLADLLVLSLRKSSLEELPKEIGELRNLILLDLSGTKCKVSANIIHKLFQLEGLYMLNSVMMHSIPEMISNDEVGTHVGEAIVKADSDQVVTSDRVKRSTDFNRLRYLNALELQIPTPKELPTDAQFVSKLDNFSLFVGLVQSDFVDEFSDWQLGTGGLVKLDFVDVIEKRKASFHRLLDINKIDDICGVLESSCLKALVKRADWLKLRSTNLEDLVPGLDEQGFKELKCLQVKDCENVKFIINKHKIIDDDLIAFPKLESLMLEKFPNLKIICDEKAPFTTFFNLQCISLSRLGSLQYVMPLALISRNMTEIKVTYCEALRYIFIQHSNGDTKFFELPRLKTLELHRVTCLVSFMGSESPSGTGSQEDAILFNHQITLPSLEKLQLGYCSKVVKIWSKELDFSGFEHLKYIRLYQCEQLSSVGPSSTFAALLQLESLTIEDCENMVEVINEEFEKCDQQIKFSELKSLKLSQLRKLVKFCGESHKLKFPTLRDLELCKLDSMSSFTGLENPSGLFHEEMTFPSLEQLDLRFCSKVVKIWSKENVFSGFRHLRTMKLNRCDQLTSIGPPSAFIALEQLEHLEIQHCKNMVEVISEEHELRDRKIRFPRLKFLTLLGLTKLVMFCDESFKLEFPTLICLTLHGLDSLSSFTGLKSPLRLFHEKIDFPYLEKLIVKRVNGQEDMEWSRGESSYQTLYQC